MIAIPQVTLVANAAAVLVYTLTDRRNWVLLTSTADCYIGPDNTVTASTGLLVKANTPYPIEPGIAPIPGAANGSIYAFATTAATITGAEMTQHGN